MKEAIVCVIGLQGCTKGFLPLPPLEETPSEELLVATYEEGP